MVGRAFSRAFTLIELLVVISIIAILAALVTSAVTSTQTRGQMLQTLNNARQLHLATQTMVLDSQANGGGGADWTYQDGKVLTVQEFCDALVKNGYLTDGEMRKLLSAPGKSVKAGSYTSGTIAFKIFPVRDSSPGDQPFLVTANWDRTGLTTNSPYGKRGFIVVRKNGEATIYTRPSDATSSEVFPSASPNGYQYTPLK